MSLEVEIYITFARFLSQRNISRRGWIKTKHGEAVFAVHILLQKASLLSAVQKSV